MPRSAKSSQGADPDGATCSQLVTSLRAVAGRFNALRDQRWHATRRVTLDPATVGTIAAAALTLLHLEHQRSRFLARKPRWTP